MTAEIILQLLLGGLLGMAGQAIRVVVGLKKLNDDASDAGAKLKDLFVPSRTVVSLLIGFVTGLLAMLSISNFQNNFLSTDTKKVILSLLAAGYAGTDFIEGFISKFLPNSLTVPDTGAGPNANKANVPSDAYRSTVSTVTQTKIPIPAQGATTHP